MAEDVASALTSSMTYGGKHSVLSEVCWSWTEFTGKIRGCPYWTELALLQRFKDPKAKVRHEHVVPIRVVINILFDLHLPTADNVFEILDRLLIGVVVDESEDDCLNVEFPADMPPEFFDPTSLSFRDPWLRYRRLPDIKVVPRPPLAIANDSRN